MKLCKSSLLCLAVGIVASSSCQGMSLDQAAKKFAHNQLGNIEKYQGFTSNKNLFDVTCSQIIKYQGGSNQEIFDKILTIQPSINEQRDSFLAPTTGIIAALTNQLNLFYIMQSAMLAAPKATPKTIRVPLDPLLSPKPDESGPWTPEKIKSITFSDHDMRWAQEELIIELEMYLSKFLKTTDYTKNPTSQGFITWLKDLHSWWVQTTFNNWIKKLNHQTKDRATDPIAQFTANDIAFFISRYIPQMLESQNTTASWPTIKKLFPGFALYENKRLFHFSEDAATQKSKDFLVKMINENLKKLAKNKK